MQNNQSFPLNRWVVNHSLLTKLTIYLLGAVLLLSFWFGVLTMIYPSQTTIVTKHKLEFVPANFLQVQDVKNYFAQAQGFGGAGGIGVPQVEMSIGQYAENTKNSPHYVVFKYDQNRRYSLLEYWTLESSKAIVTVQYFDNLWHYTFGIPFGSWRGVDARIEGQELAIRRAFGFEGLFFLLALVFIISVIVYFIGGWNLIDAKIDEATGRPRRYRDFGY